MSGLSDMIRGMFNREEKRRARTIEKFTVQRVAVTTKDDRDLTGILREVLTDAIVVSDARWLERTPQPGSMDVVESNADGSVVILLANVSSLQVLPHEE